MALSTRIPRGRLRSMRRIARKRTTAIRLRIYGGRYLVRRKRDQLGAFAGIWRRARERKPRHHPGKHAFLNWLLRGTLERDLCISALAPTLYIDARTLSRWVKEVRAITIVNPGHGRKLGLRIRIDRARVYQSMDELALAERELAARRRRRPLFLWKADRSPIPLHQERNKDQLKPIDSILASFGLKPRSPSATRFRDPDANPDSDAPDGAAVKGKDDEKTPKTELGEAVPIHSRESRRSRLARCDAGRIHRPILTSDSTPDSVSQTGVSGFRQIYEAIGDPAAGQDQDAPDGAAVKGKTWPDPKPKIRGGPEDTIVVKDPKLAQALNHFLQMGAATSRAGDAESETASGATSARASRVRVVVAIPDTIPKSDLTNR